MKHYAKRREAIHAVQWRGELTPELVALVGYAAQGDRTLTLGNGSRARVGDWIYAVHGDVDGKRVPLDVAVMDDAQFRVLFEEVEEVGRPPTAEEHEASAREFMKDLDALLVTSLRLSREEHATIFGERDRLRGRLLHLLEGEGFAAIRRERQRLRDQIKDLFP